MEERFSLNETRNTLLVDFMRIDRVLLRRLSDLLQSEVYAVVIILLKHGGYIRVPEYLDNAYRNPGHAPAAAMDSLRCWPLHQ